MQNPVRQIIAIYCLCDDFLLARGHQYAPQAKLTTAQVMTVALVVSALFCGNQDKSRVFLRDHGYIKNMLSKGCLNRPLHTVPEALWTAALTKQKQSDKSQASRLVEKRDERATPSLAMTPARVFLRRVHLINRGDLL